MPEGVGWRIEMRNDILVYTSPVLEQDLTVAGFVDIDLYVSSDAKDTDFTLKLVDVPTFAPVGRAA